MTVGLWIAGVVFLVIPSVGWSDPQADSRSGPAAITRMSELVRDLSPAELESRALREFDLGIGFRSDAAKARPHFLAASGLYDELWRRGLRDPALALNRAHSRRLSGDLPAAIVALNEGLAAARWNRPLQIALEDARSAVAYPTHSDLAALCRPAQKATIGTRMSPIEAQLIAGAVWLAACCGITRFVMTRGAAWLGFAGLCLAALAVLGGCWMHDELTRDEDEPRAIVVVIHDAQFRIGNAETFPLRLAGQSRLPKGVEARALTRRGEWVQIRLASGVIGWVPEKAILKSSD